MHGHSGPGRPKSRGHCGGRDRGAPDPPPHGGVRHRSYPQTPWRCDGTRGGRCPRRRRRMRPRAGRPQRRVAVNGCRLVMWASDVASGLNASWQRTGAVYKHSRPGGNPRRASRGNAAWPESACCLRPARGKSKAERGKRLVGRTCGRPRDRFPSGTCAPATRTIRLRVRKRIVPTRSGWSGGRRRASGARTTTLIPQRDGWRRHPPSEKRSPIAGKAAERLRAEADLKVGAVGLNADGAAATAREGPRGLGNPRAGPPGRTPSGRGLLSEAAGGTERAARRRPGARPTPQRGAPVPAGGRVTRTCAEDCEARPLRPTPLRPGHATRWRGLAVQLTLDASGHARGPGARALAPLRVNEGGATVRPAWRAGAQPRGVRVCRRAGEGRRASRHGRGARGARGRPGGVPRHGPRERRRPSAVAGALAAAGAWRSWPP